jgi:putative phosphoesterase
VFPALAGVSLILHAGDVGTGGVLEGLKRIAPVRAVVGNVDEGDPRLETQIQTEAGGLSILVTHGHELGSPTPAALLARYREDVIVFGHTHRSLIHRAGSRLVVNPGSAGPKRFRTVASIARMTIEFGRAEIEFVELD